MIPAVLPYPLDRVNSIVEESTERFKSILKRELGAFASDHLVRKWGELYRQEAKSVARAAYLKDREEKCDVV